jgi:hypothetical protein
MSGRALRFRPGFENGGGAGDDGIDRGLQKRLVVDPEDSLLASGGLELQPSLDYRLDIRAS